MEDPLRDGEAVFNSSVDSLLPSRTHNSNDQSLAVIVVDRVVGLSEMDTLDYRLKVMLGVAFMAFFATGTLFKLPVYKEMLFQPNGFLHTLKIRPINALILSGSLVHNAVQAFNAFATCASLFADTSMAQLFGQGVCKVFPFTSLVFISSPTVLDFGTSLLRILYLKHEFFVKYTVGELYSLWIILASWLVLVPTLCTLYLWENDSQRHLFNTCMGNSNFKSKVMAEYSGIPDEGILVRSLVTSIVLGLEVGNLIIFSHFFAQVYKHDNTNAIKVVKEQVIKERNRRNVISFFGQILSSISRVAFLVFGALILNLLKNFQLFRQMSNLFVHFQFTLTAVVDVLASPVLQGSMKSMFGWSRQ